MRLILLALLLLLLLSWLGVRYMSGVGLELTGEERAYLGMK